jgi:hypothetical protein
VKREAKKFHVSLSHLPKTMEGNGIRNAELTPLNSEFRNPNSERRDKNGDD